MILNIHEGIEHVEFHFKKPGSLCFGPVYCETSKSRRSYLQSAQLSDRYRITSELHRASFTSLGCGAERGKQV